MILTNALKSGKYVKADQARLRVSMDSLNYKNVTDIYIYNCKFIWQLMLLTS